MMRVALGVSLADKTPWEASKCGVRAVVHRSQWSARKMHFRRPESDSRNTGTNSITTVLPKSGVRATQQYE
ncbi:hypothetical protein IG631_17421 [Alternaria alternata]|nr:hypothetical protein IG631_17421 [Alternaria alternata]